MFRRYAKLAIRMVNGFLIVAALTVLGVGTGFVQAHHLVGEPYPWSASGWHQYERSKAYNIAFNKAVSECNDVDLIIDLDQINVTYGYVTIDDGYHTAHMSYYCKEPPPRFAKRTINPVQGPYNCDPGNAYAKAQAAADTQCALIDLSKDWFLGSFEVIGVAQPRSGECGSSGWGPNPTYSYTLLPECWLQY